MTRRPPPRWRSAGFTLLELIVVIGIFAVLAAMAYGGLSSVLNNRVRVEQNLNRTAEYQKAFIRLRQDFQNAANRTARDNDGVVRPALLYDGYRHSVEFTRGGWTNPLGLPRTGFERVAYALDDDHRLIRRSWRVLDRAPRSEPVDLVLLEGVDELHWRFLESQSNTWSEQWPPDQVGSGTNSLTASGTSTMAVPPIAVELVLKTRDWGDLRFLFQLGFDAQALQPLSQTPASNP